MFKQGFTVMGSSLRLLKPGEQGVVSRLKNLEDHLLQKLKDMGIQVGTTITIEQRFPRFIVRVNAQNFALDSRLLDIIYVRLHRVSAATRILSR